MCLCSIIVKNRHDIFDDMKPSSTCLPWIKFILAAFLFSAIECGPTMEFNECGPGCPAKCSDNPKKPKICTAECKFGCHCKSGLLLDHYGNCVAPSDCPVFVDKRCGPNTRYSSCATACPARCSDGSRKHKKCDKKCKKGCTCIRGFLLNIRGNCVSPKACDEELDA